ncbi:MULTISPECIES: hypothetical protein [Rubritalea]|uniref:Uncharacterized protein n=1 Tax=Rubritalea halochordaticola TaxID=714537 RepID=A0ABP9V435_9BACT|nr:hypothetical protein [Rubritalea squalenifaciens]
MKIFLTLFSLVCITSLSSCRLAQSAARIPGSLIQTVGRTAGLNVTHETEPVDKYEKYD